MSDDEFIAQFEACTFPFEQWHHRAHVKLAYLYLVRHGFDTALQKLQTGIRAYNAANNVPDLPTRGYHETVTQFWLRIIQTTVQEYGPLPTADEFFEFHPQLSQKKNNRLFYSPGLFMSPQAKRDFVEPDLAPLPRASKAQAGHARHAFPAQLLAARVFLRRLQNDDATAICSYRSLPEVARFQSWETFGLEDANRLVASQSGAEPGVPGTWFQMAIIDTSTGAMTGDCGLHCRADDPQQMEVGITLAPAFQGRGHATEALQCLLDFVFGVMGMHRVSATTGAENHAAAALFKRLGFRQEAHHIEHVWYKGHWESEFLFAMLKREWEAARNSRP